MAEGAEPGEKPPGDGDKFFGNFPFPYMNGYLHLGHAFSISKRNSTVGNPPEFPSAVEEEVSQPSEQEDANAGSQPFRGKKSKVAAKTGTSLYQWEIMRSFGLSDEEISKFQDPYEWLTYLPPLAVEDLKAFGLGVDWRRSFVTTDINPYFDSFVRWQMRKLKAANKIVKDKRYAIFSPLDGQPCADHDRASGEGVQPQEYTIIKMEVVPLFPAKLSALEGRKVYLAAATLRPETMYGQTNAWVLPEGKYGAFEINETDVYVVTERGALNLAYQNYSRVPEKPTCLVELTGHDLIGLPLKSPLAQNEIIYTLPMLTILTDKGTGIVTSVPSDAPDDYMALHDLKAKPALWAKFGVKDEWILPFEIIPIIDIPDFGDKPAEKVCTDLKIKSQNEKDKLAEAKRLTYLKGFTEGTMLVGEFAGEKVQDAKPKVRRKLLETGEAIMYSEPEKKVMSRSGDECVVALTDQWYITYGEPEWKELAKECLDNMNCYSDETRHGFEHTLSWLNQWACSRSFGLGTRIPWDEQYLVESLSDSTVYMAYYTVHFLQNGDIYGSNTSLIKPEQMSDDVWDFLFCSGPYPDSSDIDSNVLKSMKREFEYWYPFDLRVSGKDSYPEPFDIYNFASHKRDCMDGRILAADDALRSDSLKTGFYDLQAARDEYRFSCGAGGMNRLAGPVAEAPDLALKSANKYLQDSIVLMRKLLQKQTMGSKKAGKKGAPVQQLKTYDGWKEECLKILQSKFDSRTCTFAPDSEIMAALQTSKIGKASNFKQIQKQCMPFLRFKKDETLALGPQALELKLPFGEMKVLSENLNLIKRQLALEQVEILSYQDEDACAKAGPLTSVLKQNPPSPGNPTAIFLTNL
uniref:leucine--tRNA ligase n=1 Tax=Chenopodium quinoa TaxID=63459 RepID=A0A803MT29_CHEQI